MPMNCSLPLDPFDVWGFDFMGPFPHSNGYTHICVEVDYVTDNPQVQGIIVAQFDKYLSVEPMRS
jgi:hypothetical protein